MLDGAGDIDSSDNIQRAPLISKSAAFATQAQTTWTHGCWLRTAESSARLLRPEGCDGIFTGVSAAARTTETRRGRHTGRAAGVDALDVKAIVLVGAPPHDAALGERFGDVPLALTDVLGKPVLAHLVDQLDRLGVSAVAIISQADLPPATRVPQAARATVTWAHARGENLWRAAENAFSDHAQGGADEVLILRLGPYVELDLESFLQTHLDGPGHVTRAVDANGTRLDLFLVTAARRNEGAYLLRHRLEESRSLYGAWTSTGYWRPLENARDLRCLGVDGLLQRNRIRPVGDEIRPGVWIARGAHVHRRARVLAPAYVGSGARVRPNAVITRCGIVERHTDIGSGSVIEDASVLPYTRIGPGLDVTRALAGFQRVAHLERNVEVRVSDPRLLSAQSPSAALRALAGAASVMSLPAALLRGLLAAPQPSSLPAAVAAPSPALNTPAALSPAPSAADVSPFSRSWQ